MHFHPANWPWFLRHQGKAQSYRRSASPLENRATSFTGGKTNYVRAGKELFLDLDEYRAGRWLVQPRKYAFVRVPQEFRVNRIRQVLEISRSRMLKPSERFELLERL